MPSNAPPTNGDMAIAHRRECNIHRVQIFPRTKSANSLQCRFVDYQPAKICALAFSHPSNSKQTTPASLLLAVGRSNGDIDLWSPLYEWVHKTVPLSLSLALAAFSNRRL